MTAWKLRRQPSCSTSNTSGVAATMSPRVPIA